MPTYLIFIRLPHTFEGKHLLVNNRVYIISFNGLDHILKLRPRANHDSPQDTAPEQGLKSALLGLQPGHETNDTNHTTVLDGIQAVAQRLRATDLDDVVEAIPIRSQALRRVAPVFVFLIVDDVIGA